MQCIKHNLCPRCPLTRKISTEVLDGEPDELGTCQCQIFGLFLGGTDRWHGVEHPPWPQNRLVGKPWTASCFLTTSNLISGFECNLTEVGVLQHRLHVCLCFPFASSTFQLRLDKDTRVMRCMSLVKVGVVLLVLCLWRCRAPVRHSGTPPTLSGWSPWRALWSAVLT